MLHTVCNIFLYQRNKLFCLFFYDVDKKNQPFKSNPPGLLFSQHCFLINQSEVQQNWIKSVKSNTQQPKTKAAVIVLHRSGNYSAHHSSPSDTWFSFLNSFTEVDVWCVNRVTEPKQNKTFEFISKRPTCAFNLDTPSTPRAFFFSFTQLLPCRKISPPPLKLQWMSRCLGSLLWSLFCFVLHGLLAECLITGDNHITLRLMLQ